MCGHVSVPAFMGILAKQEKAVPLDRQPFFVLLLQAVQPRRGHIAPGAEIVGKDTDNHG